MKIEAFQISESFNIKKFRSEFRTEAFSGSTSEIFYAFSDLDRYLYIFDYGVVVFANYDEVAKSEMMIFLKNHASDLVDLNLFEEYRIQVDSQQIKTLVKNDFVIVSKIAPSILRIVMLNIGQSVVLEYYEVFTDAQIILSKHYIIELEKKGRLSIS